MTTKRQRLLVSFSPEERTRVNALAEQLRLPVSELLRRLVLAQRLPDPSDFVAWQSVRDLLKVNADLARLGNLFKLALDEPLPVDMLHRIEAMAAEISATQDELKAGARAIRTLVQPPRS